MIRSSLEEELPGQPQLPTWSAWANGLSCPGCKPGLDDWFNPSGAM